MTKNVLFVYKTFLFKVEDLVGYVAPVIIIIIIMYLYSAYYKEEHRCYSKNCAVISALYYHVEILRSIPGQGEIYMENSVSAARPVHSAVVSRPGLHLVEGIRR